METIETVTPAGFARRIAAMFYDAVLILAIFIISTFLIVPFSGEISAGNIAYPLFLYGEAAVFYIYFWCRLGQTLGMQTWRLRLVSDTGARIDVMTGVLRFAAATVSLLLLGGGFLWALFNRERLMLHDLWSDSHVEYVEVSRAARDSQAQSPPDAEKREGDVASPKRRAGRRRRKSGNR